MKVQLVLLILVTACGAAAVAADRASPQPALAAVPAASQKVVPPGERYVILDDRNRKMSEFTAGQQTPVTTDCVQVSCPPTFEKDVVCWKCKERIAAP